MKNEILSCTLSPFVIFQHGSADKEIIPDKAKVAQADGDIKEVKQTKKKIMVILEYLTVIFVSVVTTILTRLLIEWLGTILL